MEMESGIGVIFDVGSQITKAGFAGEHFPRAVFPTTVGRLRREGLVDGFPLLTFGKEAVAKRGISNLTWPMDSGVVSNWDEMEKLWHHTFYSEIHVPPEEANVLHSVHALVERSHKEKIAEILFESFAIKGLYLAKTPVLILHASGRTSGIVWESGYSCSYAAPVFEGFPLKYSTISSPLTGKALTDKLQKLLKETGYSFTTSVEIDLLDRIKAETCYVALDFDEEIKSAKCSGENKLKYTLPDGQTILLSEERFRCPELLFQPALDGLKYQGIPDLICKAIKKCPLDYRQMFFENVVVAGGTSMLPGVVNRLRKELSLKKKLFGKSEVDDLETKQFAVWTGGSILASLSSMKGFWMTKDEYEDEGVDRVKYKFF